jgi:cytochrome P450
MLQKVFLQFAAAVIGLKGVDTPSGRDELQTAFRSLPLAHLVRFMTQGREAAIEASIASRNDYGARFVTPSLDDVRAQIAANGSVAESLLSLVAQLTDPAWENRDYAMSDAIAFLIGSVDTSTHGVVQTVHELSRWFAAHPEEIKRREDIGFLNRALEEALRLRVSSPVLGRIAAEDFVLANGKAIKKGQPVAIYHSLANRDRSVFGHDADEFNPHREPMRNVSRYGVAFGAGSHMCIGQRIVVGADAMTSSHAQVLRALFAAGISPDPAEEPTLLEGQMVVRFVKFPVIFTTWTAAS